MSGRFARAPNDEMNSAGALQQRGVLGTAGTAGTVPLLSVGRARVDIGLEQRPLPEAEHDPPQQGPRVDELERVAAVVLRQLEPPGVRELPTGQRTAVNRVQRGVQRGSRVRASSRRGCGGCSGSGLLPSGGGSHASSVRGGCGLLPPGWLPPGSEWLPHGCGCGCSEWLPHVSSVRGGCGLRDSQGQGCRLLPRGRVERGGGGGLPSEPSVRVPTGLRVHSVVLGERAQCVSVHQRQDLEDGVRVVLERAVGALLAQADGLVDALVLRTRWPETELR